MSCITPAVSRAYSTTLGISVNGVDFADSGFMFHFHDGPLVLSMLPTYGPVSGSTRVQLMHTPIDASVEVWCTFSDSDSVKADRPSVQVAECSTPSHAEGAASVGLALNAHDAPDSNNTFVFIAFDDALAIYPTLGPEHGGTRLTFSMPSFTGGYCLFGSGATSPIVQTSAYLAHCVTPPIKPGIARVLLSAPSQEYTLDPGFNFTVYSQPEIHDVSPRAISPSNHGKVTLHGRAFANETSLSCQVGDEIIPATFVDESRVECMVGHLRSGKLEGGADQVSLNGEDFAGDSSTVEFLPLPIISSLWPLHGPRKVERLLVRTA